MAAQLSQVMGKRVVLHYKEYRYLPTTCFGETTYFVDRVEVRSNVCFRDLTTIVFFLKTSNIPTPTTAITPNTAGSPTPISIPACARNSCRRCRQ